MSVLSAQFPTMMTMPEIFTFCWDCIKNLLLIENLLPCANLGLLLQHLPNPFSVSYVDLIISECTITCIFHQSSAESDPSNLTSSNLYATRYLLLNLKFKFQKTISTWKSNYVLVYHVISIQWVYRFFKKRWVLVFFMEIFLTAVWCKGLSELSCPISKSFNILCNLWSKIIHLRKSGLPIDIVVESM